MKSTGIVRNIDELGRLVVPKELRKKLGIKENDPVEIYVEGDKIVIAKYRSLCHFCGAATDVIEFRDKIICKNCLDDLTALNTSDN